jgi:hypothetical protein
MNFSKTIKKADDSSKELIIEALAGTVTYGFDVDSIYYFETEKKWLIIEFLKCDHPKVRPSTSHPRRYWDNWRKFASIWRLRTDLKADLFLVNYEDQSHAAAQGRADREFHIIFVEDMNPTESGGITKEKTETMTFQGFKSWFQKINARGGV